jgi:hypothetical protein
VVIAVPWAAGTAGASRTVESGATRSTGSVVTRSTGPAGSVIARASWATGSTRSVVTWATGSAGSVIARASWATGSAGSVIARSAGSGATWPTGSTRSTRPARSVAASAARILGSGSSVADRGCAMATGLRPRSGAGRTGPHAQRGCPEGAGDGRSGHQLLQFHGPSPVYLDIQRTLAPRRTER